MTVIVSTMGAGFAVSAAPTKEISKREQQSQAAGLLNNCWTVDHVL
jgi:hypothetical protein